MIPNISQAQKHSELTAHMYNRVVQDLYVGREVRSRPRGGPNYWLGVILDHGPPDAAHSVDFCGDDPRYWVRQAVIRTTRIEQSVRHYCGYEQQEMPGPMTAGSDEPPISVETLFGDPLGHVIEADLQFLPYGTGGLLWVPAINIQQVAARHAGLPTERLEPGMAVHVFTIEDSNRVVHPAFLPSAGSQGGTRDVVLWLTVEEEDDAGGNVEIVQDLTQVGPHLSCYGRDQDGDLFIGPFPVFPNYDHPLSEFKKQDGSQIWSEDEPVQERPTWTAHRAPRGWILGLGEAEAWGPQPGEDEICA